MTHAADSSPPLDQRRVADAYAEVRRMIWEHRQEHSPATPPGPSGSRPLAPHWRGQLADSAVSTATAVSALVLLARHDPAARSESIDQRIAGGLQWLLRQQLDDGGWGDTELSYANISATMLARAALHLALAQQSQAAATESSVWLPDRSQVLAAAARAEQWIAARGGVPALRRRYGKDKTFAVPILANCALAGLVEWREVFPLPFELACLPQSWYRFLNLPVVSYAIPALVAIGQVRFHHLPCWPPWSWLRAASRQRSLAVLQDMQPASGGFLEAIPLTSFVVMSLAASGQAAHPVARLGAEFLLRTAGEHGGWPIDADLATWNTSLILNALDEAGEDVGQAIGVEGLQWLLSCQHRQRHPFTGAAPGGWGWTDLSGAVPDADDTPGALLALRALRRSGMVDPPLAARIDEAAQLGCRWLLDLQNRDGGWPTFCRGWGKLPFDRSGADLTAHALRALAAWRDATPQSWRRRVDAATTRGWNYLEQQQREDGAWVPLWFGNQDDPAEENPVYGTAKVLEAYVAAGRTASKPAQRGWEWLRRCQRSDGGWGGGPEAASVEETALAVHSLAAVAPALSCQDRDENAAALRRGLCWLIHRVDSGGVRVRSPIGFYFAKLWYHERLYPLVFTLAALGRVLGRRLAPPVAS